MCRFKNIPDILFSNPTLFSEYTDIVNHFFSISLYLPLYQKGFELVILRVFIFWPLRSSPRTAPTHPIRQVMEFLDPYFKRISDTDAPEGIIGKTFSSFSTVTSRK